MIFSVSSILLPDGSSSSDFKAELLPDGSSSSDLSVKLERSRVAGLVGGLVGVVVK
jgi:hypothetical protein